ncbi:hypothetical protein COP1_044397 [Malus domestica]
MSVCPVERGYGHRLIPPLTLHFDELSCCLSQLEILELETNGAVYCENLYLQNRVSLLGETCVEARPRWQSARWRNVGEGEKLDIPEKCPSQNNYFKVVEIIGYRPPPCVTQYVKFLIENMVGLGKIIVDPVFHHWSLDRAIFRYDFPIEEAQAREHAMQHLEELVPLTVEFACL